MSQDKFESWGSIVRHFLSPVEQSQIPELRKHILAGGFQHSMISAVIAPFLALLGLVMLPGSGDRPEAWAFSLFYLAVVLALSLPLLLRSKKDREGTEWLVIAQELVHGAYVFCLDFLCTGASGVLVLAALLIPLGLPVFLPLHPIKIGAMASAWVGIFAVANMGLPETARFSSEALVGTALIFFLSGAVGSQIHRGIWRGLRQSRERSLAMSRLAELGARSAGIAHNLNTPIASAFNALHTLRDLQAEWSESVGHPDVEPDDLQEIAEEIHEHIQSALQAMGRMENYLERVERETQAPRGQKPTDFLVYGCLSNLRELMRGSFRVGHADLDLSGVDPTLKLRAVQQSFGQIFINLFKEMLSAHTEEHKMISVESQVGERFVYFLLAINPVENMEDATRNTLKTAPPISSESQNEMVLSLCQDIARTVFRGDLRQMFTGEQTSYLLSVDVCFVKHHSGNLAHQTNSARSFA